MSAKLWDTLICGGKVFDGNGGAPEFIDIAIKDGLIAKRASGLNKQDAEQVIDATGQWVMPGLLDIHTHFDLEVEIAPGLPESVRHGTTAVVVSNCSLGLAFGAQRRNGDDPIIDCFARVENIPKPVLNKVAEQATWNDSADYLAHLDTLALGPNIAPMIPHSMLRIEAMGLQDSISREPSEAELEKMEGLVEKGMREGYCGFSTDALPFHYLACDPNRKTKIPGQFGSYRELKRLTDIVRRHSRVWQATPPKDNPLRILRNFSLTSGRLHGKPLRVTAVAALDIATNKGIVKLAKLMAKMFNSKFLNGQFALQALAAPFKVWSEGALTPLFEEIPELRELNEPDLEDRAARMAILDNPDYQRRFCKMWRTGKSGFGLARLRRLLRREQMAFGRVLSEMVIERCPIEAWHGESMQAVFDRVAAFQASGEGARSEQERAALDAFPKPLVDDANFMLHILREYDTDMYWHSVTANRDPKVLRDLLMEKNLLPGFNDSGAHLTNMAFYDGNLRALRIAAEEGDECLAYTINRLTRLPAEFFDLDCGRIEIGDVADVAVIDPAKLAAYEAEDHIRSIYRPEFEHTQLVNRSDGVVTHVLIGGKPAWQNGHYNEQFGKEKFGAVLRADHKRSEQHTGNASQAQENKVA